MPLAPVNGTEMFYVEVGTAPPCLVMHGGLGLDHTYLHPWLDPLGDALRLVYYDHRGHGRSGRPPLETLTFEQLAADADALREHLALDRVAVMGHSYGGFIALHYALRHPRRVSRLILMNTAPAWDYADEIAANARGRRAGEDVLAVLAHDLPAEDAELARALRLITPLYFSTFDPGTAKRLFARTILRGAATARGERLLRDYNLVPRLGEISAPTLILTGRDDFLAPPSQAARLHRGIRRSELVVFERSGHFPYAEEPEAFFAAVRGWLARSA